MNIGTITQNASGTYTGKISTLTVAIVIALRTVHSANPRAPKFEILALSAARQWVQVGSLFELASNATGEMFLNGKIEDPSLDEPAKPNGLAGTDGLGESSAEGAFGGEPAQGNGRRRRTPEMAD